MRDDGGRDLQYAGQYDGNSGSRGRYRYPGTRERDSRLVPTKPKCRGESMRRRQPIAERPINERVALRAISRRLETSRPDETDGRDPVDLTRRMAELDHIWRLPEDELSRPRNEEKAEANTASPNKTLYIIKIIIGSLKFILIVKTTISYYLYITGELQRQPIAEQSKRIIRSLTRELLFYVIKTYRNSRVAINYYFLLLNASTRKAQRRTGGKLTIIFTSIERVARCLAGGPSEQKRRVDTSACYTTLLLFYYWLLFYYFYYFYYTTRLPIDGRANERNGVNILLCQWREYAIPRVERTWWS